MYHQKGTKHHQPESDRGRLDPVADAAPSPPPVSSTRSPAEQFVERLNARGGLLGRQVQWKVLDDQSDSAKVGQLYEQLISQDKVDLIIGPYATPNILSAMAVAERHNFVMPQHTAVLRAAADLRLPVPGVVDRDDAEPVRPQPAPRRGGEPAHPAEDASRCLPARAARPLSSPTGSATTRPG